MRKAERLFQIITLLRGRRTVFTAATMAELLEVSERTYLIKEQRYSSLNDVEVTAGAKGA